MIFWPKKKSLREEQISKFKEKSAILIDLLDVEDVIAQLLVTEGYVTIESIVSETPENLRKNWRFW